MRVVVFIAGRADRAAVAPADRRLFARCRGTASVVNDVVPGSAPTWAGRGLRAKSAGMR
jgi:hypothetical protein